MENFLNKMQKIWDNKMMRIFISTIILIILIIIIVLVATSKGGKSLTENGLVNASKKYLNSNANMLPTNEYDYRTINLDTLVSNGYIKSSNGCNGYVTVVKIDNEYVYTPYLNCGNNSNETLVNHIKANTVTNGDGLYNINGNYIFRGENPNNYVSFGGLKWRIIGIDKSNNIKMMYSDIYVDYEVWDDRYNSVVDSQDGINDYKVSRAKEYLDNYITNNAELFTPERKAKLTRYDVCIGKVNMSDAKVDSCNEVLSNQLTSIITVNDYMNASLDSACSTTNIKNCQNYNFLNLNGWTITAKNTDNLYVYYVNNEEGIVESKGYIGKAMRTIIALRNDTLLVSGTGTEIDPYIIK